MNSFIKKIARQLPPIKRLLKYQTLWEPGHYYSAIPGKEDALAIAEKSLQLIYDIKGVDLHEEMQLRLFDELVPYMRESSFRNEEKTEGHRFYNKNTIYGYSDALILEAMIRHLKPARIVEAGSGYTSALMMDVNEKYFNNNIHLNFIEPYPGEIV